MPKVTLGNDSYSELESNPPPSRLQANPVPLRLYGVNYILVLCSLLCVRSINSIKIIYKLCYYMYLGVVFWPVVLSQQVQTESMSGHCLLESFQLVVAWVELVPLLWDSTLNVNKCVNV